MIRILSLESVNAGNVQNYFIHLVCSQMHSRHLPLKPLPADDEIPTLSTDCTFLYREKYICKYIENSSIKILSVSEAISTYYSRYLTDKTKIERIHYAIEIPSITSTPNHIYTLIMVGSFNENKGQKEAVYASNIVKNKYQIPFQLLLVGAIKGKDEAQGKVEYHHCEQLLAEEPL